MNLPAKKITSFIDLDAWKVGHEIVLAIYRITRQYPREEMYGLISQMRRCAVSITSNIAEGFTRQSYREKIQFYSIAHGSITELQNQLIISKDLNLITTTEYTNLFELTIRIHKIVTGLIKSSRNRIS